MALIKCKECGAKVSTTAKACPQCGASAPKQTSGCAWIALIFFGIPMIAGIAYQASTGPARKAEEAAKEAQRVAALSPEQKAEELRNSRVYSGKSACRINAKEVMKDPSSAEFVGYGSATASTDGSTVSVPVTYRAKNSFGAIVPSTVICTVRLNGEMWVPVELKAE